MADVGAAGQNLENNPMHSRPGQTNQRLAKPAWRRCGFCEIRL